MPNTIHLPEGTQPGSHFADYQGNDINRFVADVDGTLVVADSDHGFSSGMLEEMHGAFNDGMSQGLQTARGLAKTQHLINTMMEQAVDTRVGVEGARYHGLSNGAEIWDEKEGKFVARYQIPDDITEEIEALFHKQTGDAFYWINDGGVDYAPMAKGMLNVYGKARNLRLDPKGNNLELVSGYDKPRAPLVIVGAELTPSQFNEIMEYGNSFSDRGVKTVLQSQSGGGADARYKVFVSHELANKKHALEVIADLSRTTLDHTAVVGDGANDAIMLKTAVDAGGVGFAMANASDATKAEATLIVPSQTEDGATLALNIARSLRG